MEIITILGLAFLFSLSNVVCLIVGVRIGQKASMGEEVRLPNLIEKVREIRDTNDRTKEQEAIKTMLYNIDVYDGTGMGQRDIS